MLFIGSKNDELMAEVYAKAEADWDRMPDLLKFELYGYYVGGLTNEIDELVEVCNSDKVMRCRMMCTAVMLELWFTGQFEAIAEVEVFIDKTDKLYNGVLNEDEFRDTDWIGRYEPLNVDEVRVGLTVIMNKWLPYFEGRLEMMIYRYGLFVSVVPDYVTRFEAHLVQGNQVTELIGSRYTGGLGYMTLKRVAGIHKYLRALLGYMEAMRELRYTYGTAESWKRRSTGETGTGPENSRIVYDVVFGYELDESNPGIRQWDKDRVEDSYLWSGRLIEGLWSEWVEFIVGYEWLAEGVGGLISDRHMAFSKWVVYGYVGDGLVDDAETSILSSYLSVARAVDGYLSGFDLDTREFYEKMVNDSGCIVDCQGHLELLKRRFAGEIDAEPGGLGLLEQAGVWNFDRFGYYRGLGKPNLLINLGYFMADQRAFGENLDVYRRYGLLELAKKRDFVWDLLDEIDSVRLYNTGDWVKPKNIKGFLNRRKHVLTDNGLVNSVNGSKILAKFADKLVLEAVLKGRGVRYQSKKRCKYRVLLGLYEQNPNLFEEKLGDVKPFRYGR